MKRIYEPPKDEGNGEMMVVLVVGRVGPEKKTIEKRCFFNQEVLSICDLDHGLGRAYLDRVAIRLPYDYIDVVIDMLKRTKESLTEE